MGNSVSVLETVWYDSAICRQGKKCKKHWGFPTKVSDMARNMKMELHTFSLILYQSKKCGHRIHVLFMMYDVYWYCQMKKKRMIMKILKKEWFIWKFWKKGGGSREKGGRRKRNPCPMRLWFFRENSWFGQFRHALSKYAKTNIPSWLCFRDIYDRISTIFFKIRIFIAVKKISISKR